ncbi:uncharacterized protein LOC116338992 [Contarinia nasturtii]|uniref:uncharacterized protein LOC116338992 n=1 Tax=Contarinia nasturtii TaxID=265458 RepID=UPI0012D3818F|nr:uncharacterized protein LOC116338992 [Contarinia nasturtii]
MVHEGKDFGKYLGYAGISGSIFMAGFVQMAKEWIASIAKSYPPEDLHELRYTILFVSVLYLVASTVWLYGVYNEHFKYSLVMLIISTVYWILVVIQYWTKRQGELNGMDYIMIGLTVLKMAYIYLASTMKPTTRLRCSSSIRPSCSPASYSGHSAHNVQWRNC